MAAAWGQGYATEAAGAARDDALGRLGLGIDVELWRTGS
jgi:RimJ/RimL family protein N-acetyltransferase